MTALTDAILALGAAIPPELRRWQQEPRWRFPYSAADWICRPEAADAAIKALAIELACSRSRESALRDTVAEQERELAALRDTVAEQDRELAAERERTALVGSEVLRGLRRLVAMQEQELDELR